MVDMVLMSGRGAGPRYVNIEDANDVWTLLSPRPGTMASPAPAGIPYERLGALGDLITPAPILYSVELDIAEENLPAIYEWYEKEHLPMLTSVPGCLGGIRWRRLDGGAPNLMATYRFARLGVNESPEWIAGRSTEWTARVRGMFRIQRRYIRRLEA